MARLSELTDSYYDPMGNAQPALPVEQPFVNNLKRVVITGEPEPELPVTFSEAPDLSRSSPLSNNVDKILNALFRDDEKRLQLWPEKLLRAGATAAGDVAAGKVPLWSIDNETGDVHTSPQMIEKAQEISALAGSGGLANPAKGATLNATPSLRPALKHNEKLYKGKPGQEHQDIIPDTLYNDFQKKAMRGDDLAEYNFGFVNDKGHFLSREDALKYGIDNGLIDPQAGKFGTLTSTMFADSSKPGAAIEAMKPTFYSALEHNVGQISQGKMNGEAWLGTLANKPGVKPEELDWTGLKSFLEENKGNPVTKEQIQEHLASNKVELKEVVRDQTPAVYNENTGLPNKTLKENQFPTKYHSYQLPGGENYREMLLTLPTKRKQIGVSEGEFGGMPIVEQTPSQPFKSSHWDEPNILAHVRMNDRTVDGKKSLHLEEIQSDWHQQGRDKGYRPEQEKKLAGLVEQREALQKEASTLAPSDARYKEIYKELPTIQTKINEIGSSNVGVPDAPFKKSWHELALKRMIREASEKGYDRLSWTPGEAQAARYDLSKDVSKVYLNNPVWHGENDIRGNLIVTGKNGNDLISKPVKSISEIKDLIGKEAADNLVNKPSSMQGRDHVLSGEGLKVGGEGMKGFYDQIIPKALEKLGKEHGVKVKKANIIAPMKKMGDSGEQPIYYIDIPQSLRDTATQKGFPLFSKGGYMLQPVDYEPEFKK